MDRRSWLKRVGSIGLLALVSPLRALAAAWNRPAFESQTVGGALKGLGIGQAGPSRDIVLIAPDMAENGAIVQVEVESRIPGTEAITILVDKNPTPLIANFVFSNGADPYVVTRIKMAESSELKVIVKAGGQYFSAVKQVQVAQGGCD
ncbi:sulfur oxidation protein SoxY [mine drainage metagenome]|uniref:Sulfur oxidation protein SoxY n=1 Tax=mine drainage metagenome TaxID=410659 RepID=A0A1J5Q8V0_9ZZZZ